MHKDLVRQLLENAANETGVPVSTEEPDGTLVLGVAMSVPEDATDTQSRYCLVYERFPKGNLSYAILTSAQALVPHCDGGPPNIHRQPDKDLIL